MLKKLFHIHDYDMQFPYEGHGALRYVLRCKCGDQCLDMADAIRRTQRSKTRVWSFLIGGWLLAFVNVLWFLGH